MLREIDCKAGCCRRRIACKAGSHKRASHIGGSYMGGSHKGGSHIQPASTLKSLLRTRCRYSFGVMVLMRLNNDEK